MAQYKSEFVEIKFKFTGKALVKEKGIESNICQFDNILNARSKEGWELVSYSCTAAPYSMHGFLLTFRKD